MDSSSDSINDSDLGNFNLEFQDIDILDFALADDDADLVNASDAATSTVDIAKFQELLQQSEFDGLPKPEVPTKPMTRVEQPRKRFRQISEDELKSYENMNQSKRTKENTKWGMKILQDWHFETYGGPINMNEVTAEELAEKLKKFYAETRPQPPNKKIKSGTENIADYSKNTLKNIRGAINRHLADINRDIDIVHDKLFKSANNALNGVLKLRLATGKSKPTQHKAIINESDLKKISTYFDKAGSHPVVLRQCVWYNIAIHFVTRGLEFHHQLGVDSFVFNKDENDVEYVCLSHETLAKNYQGGLSNVEDSSDKRMYATGMDNCPVKMLKLFLSKTDKNAVGLFNKCVKDSLINPNIHEIWYTSEKLSLHTFKNFMKDVSKSAGCQNQYTAHCIRATCIQNLSDAGIETRKIMYWSGHRNEASVRSYSRDISTNQKQTISSILSSTAGGDTSSISLVPASTESNKTVTQSGQSSQIINPQLGFSLSSFHPSMLSNSTFNSCSFNFNMKM